MVSWRDDLDARSAKNCKTGALITLAGGVFTPFHRKIHSSALQSG